MPLRALLLLPDGEQPSVIDNTKPPKSPSSASFRTILNGAVQSRSPSPQLSHNGDYTFKPLPSPPALDSASVNRASSQTHLTLPSTSGSSAGSSREYAPSPPLSPSPTSSPGSPFRAPYDDVDTVTSVRGLKLSKKKGKPRLFINTKLPKTGRGVHYISSSSRASGLYEESEERSNDHGEETARRAVDARLQHLLATTSLAPADETEARLSKASHHGDPSPRLVLPHQSSLSPKKPGNKGKVKQYSLHQSDPPPPPTTGLAPYRVFGKDEEVPFDVISDPRVAKRIPVKVGWKRTGVLIRSMRPKGSKGRYIRLVTALPLPPKKEDNLDYEEGLVDIKIKGRMPTVLMEDDWADSDDSDDENEKEQPTRHEIPTVYMTELVATQYDRPVPCMMIPLPAHIPSNALSKRLSTLSTISSAPQILSVPSKAYQFPLPILTTIQKTTLVNARMLVYAVPSGYSGTIPPPECTQVGEEIVPPWVSAAAQLPMLNTAHAARLAQRQRTATSPRTSVFGLGGVVSPRGSMLNPAVGNVITAGNGLGVNTGNTGPSGSLSPRWPVEGLWSRAQRNSTASVLSAESPAPSRPTSLVPSEKSAAGEERDAGAATSSWVSSLSSIRAKAQEYYTKDKDTHVSPASSNTSLPTSKSDVLPAGSSPAENTSVPTSVSVGASRFGSLFLRTPSSTGTTSTGGITSPSGPATPSTADLHTPGTGPTMGQVLFEFTEPPKDGEIVKVEIVEAPIVEASTTSRWKGWGARWGS